MSVFLLLRGFEIKHPKYKNLFAVTNVALLKISVDFTDSFLHGIL